MPCRFCGGTDSDGHLFGSVLFPPLVEIREHPEFHDLVEMDKSSWPLGVNGGSPLGCEPPGRCF